MTAFSWAVLCAVFWGTVPVLERFGLLKADIYAGLFMRCLGTMAGLLILLFTVPDLKLKLATMGGRTAGILALAGFLASFVGQIAAYQALKKGEVTQVTPVTGSFPLVAFLLGWLWLGETLTWKKVLGMLFIIGGATLLR